MYNCLRQAKDCLRTPTLHLSSWQLSRTKRLPRYGVLEARTLQTGKDGRAFFALRTEYCTLPSPAALGTISFPAQTTLLAGSLEGMLLTS
jgi:hypothetical protein